MKRGCCIFEDGKTRDCPWSKSGGCSFQIGTPTQRVSTPPPPEVEGLLSRQSGIGKEQLGWRREMGRQGEREARQEDSIDG